MLNSGEKFILSQLTRLRGNKPEHTISGPTKSTCLLTAEFLRERLTWVFSEPGLIISVLTIKNVQLEENLDLRGVTTKSAVVFLDCQLQGLQLSDSSIRSLYFRGGKIGRIEAVRTRLTGSFDLNPESGTGSKPHQACSRCTHVAEGIELSGAEIGGNLDLRGLDMTPRGQCENNIIDNFSLRADGIVVRGNVLLSRGFKASSAVRLNGCFIGRDLDFSGSEVTCLGDYAISLAGGHVKGNLRFSRTAEIRSKTEGTVRLSNATVDGTLDFSYLTCSASRNENQRHHVGVKLGEEYCYALNAQGVTVGGALRLDELVSQGPLNFINATIRGGITGTGMKIHFPMAHAFLADNAKVTGSVYLNSLETSGILRFVQSDLSGGLYLRNIVFLPPEYEGDVEGLRPTRLRNWRKAMRGLVADRATITGGFELEHVNAHKFDRAVSRLTLEGAKIPGIDKKTLDSFKKFDYVHLLNCEYSSIITHERLSSQDPPTSPSMLEKFVSILFPALSGRRSSSGTAVGSQCGSRAPENSSPSVQIWLDILDREYAPMAATTGPETYPSLPYTYNGFNRFTIAVIFFVQAILTILRLPFRILFGQPRRLLRWLGNAPREANLNGHHVFHPQPYLHLARRMREAGFDRHATEVLIAMEWRRTWYGDLSVEAKAWQVVKGYFLEFGFNKIRPIKILLIFVFFSTFVFQYGYENGAIIPAKSNQIYTQCTPALDASADSGHPVNCVADSYDTSNAYVRFNGLLFAFDAILPLADLGQRKNWIIEPVSGFETSWRDVPSEKKLIKQHPVTAWSLYLEIMRKMVIFHLIALLFLVDIVCGSLLTGLFIVGLSGVISNRY